MDIQTIVTQLKQEVSRIEHAISALLGLGSQPARRGRPPKSIQPKAASRNGRRRTMSASARAKIAAAQRARWAKQKGTATSKKAASTPAKTKAAAKNGSGRKGMSPAARKRLSALMKARWAARKKQQ